MPAHDHKAPPEASQDEARELTIDCGDDASLSVEDCGDTLLITATTYQGFNTWDFASANVNAVKQLVAFAQRWLDSKAHHHPHSTAADHPERRDAQASEHAVDHVTDRNGRPLGCDVCRHAAARFNGGNGATTCSELDDRIVAVGRNKPNYRPLGCPFNGGG